MKYVLNEPKVALESFRHYLRGTKKVGKSSLFRDLIIEYYGDPKYGLMIAPGNETGFKALDNLYAVEAPTWEDFCDVVDDLVLNKDDNEFKIVAIDTVDELIAIAEEKVLKIHYQRKGEKATSINGALGGYGAGKKMLRKLINDKIKELESAGYENNRMPLLCGNI